jgi:hypothetical protein
MPYIKGWREYALHGDDTTGGERVPCELLGGYTISKPRR